MTLFALLGKSVEDLSEKGKSPGLIANAKRLIISISESCKNSEIKVLHLNYK